jgi:hypothetical protein
VVIQWTQTAQGFNIVQSADWNYRGAGMNSNSGLPVDAGVTPKGDIWLFYSGYYGGTSVFWLDPTGKILGSFSAPFIQSTHLVGIDGVGTTYICGLGFSSAEDSGTKCQAYRQDATSPLWTYTFDPGVYGVTGGVMAPGRLYVITPEGSLTALADTGSAPPAPTATP